jgi:hypothetical protein
MDESTNIIKEQVSFLPPELKKYLAEGIWKDKVKAIGAEFALNEEQTSTLQFETMMVLIGLEDSANLSQNMQANLQIPLDIAEKLAINLKEKVLMEIQQFLPIFQGEKEPEIIDGTNIQVDTLMTSTAPSSPIPPKVPLDTPQQIEIKKTEAGLGFLDAKLGGTLSTPQENNLSLPSSQIGAMQANKENTDMQAAPAAVSAKEYEGTKDPYREALS